MTTRSLGELGAVSGAPEREELSFTYFGSEIRVNPKLSDLVVLDLMDRSASIVIPEDGDEPDPEAMKAANDLITNFLRRAVHPDDFGSLWDAALDNGQGIAQLMALSMTLVEAVSERPTKKPSASRGGRRNTKRRSVAESSSEGTSRRVIRELEKRGRPDQAQVVQLAAAARSAS